MKRQILVSFLVLFSLASFGHNKINPMGTLLLNDYNTAIIESAGDLRRAPADLQQGILVKVSEHCDISSLENLGFEVIDQFGDIYSGVIRLSAIEALAELPEVISISLGESLKPLMNFARVSGNVDQVQIGFTEKDAQHSYTGKGVITGMMDTGLEANHINFYGQNGVSRIKRLWHFYNNTGVSREYTQDNMYRFITDDGNDTHATHVAGIMCGSYNGNGTYYLSNSPLSSSAVYKENEPIPYYGVAIESDPAFSVGSLADNNIINGVKKIVEYAKSEGKPAVINLSIGGNYGPHDGSDLICQAISECTKDAIICIAAGNEGAKSIFAGKDFTTDDTTMKVQFVDNSVNGTVDVWGNNSNTFRLKWAIYNTNTKAFEIITEAPVSGTRTIDASNSVFAKYFSGSIQMSSMLSSLNNRYNVLCLCSGVKPKSGNLAGKLSMIVEGEAGQKIYAYGSEGQSGDAQFDPDIFLEGWTQGSFDNSLSDLACAENVIVVGSYATRKYVTPLSGSGYYYPSVTVGNISSFSSFGETFQGEARPQICAPGEVIISSINRSTVSNANKTAAMAYNEWEDYNDYWDPLQGTSMATPYVSGVIALWLEACPTLDYNQIIDVLKNASTTDSQTKREPEAFGYGKINALEGIKYILSKYAGVENVWADDDMRLIVNAVDGGYEVFVAGESSVEANVVDMQGRVVASAQADGCEVTVPTDGLGSGVYVLDIRGASSRFARKVRVR